MDFKQKTQDIIDLRKEIADNQAKIAEAMKEDEREAYRLGGVVDALNERLDSELQTMANYAGYEERRESEDAQRQNAGTAVTNVVASPKDGRKTLAELFLGPRDRYEGLPTAQDATVKRKFDIENVLDIPTPWEVDWNLPTTEAPMGGFLGSILKGTTTGNIQFAQPAPLTNRLVSPTWEKGLKKPPQTLSWETAYAYCEMVAYTMPVELVALMDYPYLETVINVEMRNGIVRAQRFYSVLGNNPNGIVGILDPQSGVPEVQSSDFDGDSLVDMIEKIATRQFLRTGVRPDCVCMHPLVSEQLKLMKREEGSNEYLDITINGQIWGLRIVEDEYFMDFKEDGSDPTDSWLLVYRHDAAIWKTKNEISMASMPVGEQFLENRTTFRMEAAYLLQILDPNKFTKMKVKINEKDGALTRTIAPMPAPRGITVIGYGSDGLKGSTMNVAEFGHFAVDGKDLVGVADKLTGYKAYSKDSAKQDGYFCALSVTPGSKVQKDAEAEKTVDADGIVVVGLGKESITAKKLKVTDPDDNETTLNIKVTANAGASKRQGPRVTSR